MNKIKTARSGTSLGVTLFIVFLILKLCGVITWSWIWITAPLWVPIFMTGIIAIIIFLFIIIIELIKIIK